MQLLVKYNDNWADEMDISGFHVFEPDVWEEYQKNVAAYFEKNSSYTFYVGTNEEIEYENVDDFMAALTVVEIDNKFAQKLIEVFETDDFGFFPDRFITYDPNSEEDDDADW